MLRDKELLDLISKSKLLSDDKLAEAKSAMTKASFDLEFWLTRNHLIDGEKLAEIKAKICGLPYISLVSESVSDNALHLLNKDIAKNYSAVCFSKKDGVAKFGLVNFDIKAMEAINFQAAAKGLKPEYYLISKESFAHLFRGFEKMEEEISTALQTKAKDSDPEDAVQIKQEDSDLLGEDDANSAPVAKIVSVIIKNAVESRASDIHIEPYHNESRVRYRIDGILHNSLTLPKAIHGSVVARIKVLSRLKLDETRIPQDGRIRLMVSGKEIDLRISTLPLSMAEKVEMRILDQSKGLATMEQLGFNSFCHKTVLEGFKRTSGIILLTGPTGSGKTTSLYAFLNVLNTESVNISTLEDPIEYQIKGINQAQVRPDLGFTFATGLRSFLRQDPNIIMVGEIRDHETAELAIHAGLTGHLVLSSLHTNDSLGAIFRLLDMDLEPFLLASTLRLVMAQRLPRKLCVHCKKEVKLEDDLMNKFIDILKDAPQDIVLKELNIKTLEEIKKAKYYEPVGCQYCSNTGYLERIAVAEALVINDELVDLIVNHKDQLTMEIVKKTQPFISMKQDCLFKVIRGVTNLKEVMRVVEIEQL